MNRKTLAALLILLGGSHRLAVGADSDIRYGEPGTGSTSSQSGTAPGSSRSPSLPTQGGPTGNETSGAADSAGPNTSFEHFDTDKDGRISELEARNAKITRSGFDRLDTDRDGRVSFTEWEAAQSRRGAAGVKGADRPSPAWSPERPDLPNR